MGPLSAVRVPKEGETSTFLLVQLLSPFSVKSVMNSDTSEQDRKPKRPKLSTLFWPLVCNFVDLRSMA